MCIVMGHCLWFSVTELCAEWHSENFLVTESYHTCFRLESLPRNMFLCRRNFALLWISQERVIVACHFKKRIRECRRVYSLKTFEQYWYTGCSKKTDPLICFCNNFGKCKPILILFSLLQQENYCAQNLSYFSHLTFIMLPLYLAK